MALLVLGKNGEIRSCAGIKKYGSCAECKKHQEKEKSLAYKLGKKVKGVENRGR